MSKVDLEKQRREIERLRREMSAARREHWLVTTRATARILENIHPEGRMRQFAVEADEPLAWGGAERGPWSARLFDCSTVPTSDASCDVRATFVKMEKYDVDDEDPYAWASARRIRSWSCIDAPG